MRPPHRPKRSAQPCSLCKQRAEEIVADITFFLTRLCSGDIVSSMKITEHPIERQMRQRLHHEIARSQEIRKRMQELAPAYNEFLDLRAEGEQRKARLLILYGLIGDDIHTPNPLFVERGAREITGGTDKSLRDALPLWEAMREYLHYVPEARIGEMEEFFSHIGYGEGNRQAIESALKRHPKEFRIRKKKREKYLSLRQ